MSQTNNNTTSTLAQLAARLMTRAAFKGSTIASLEALGEETLRRLDDATTETPKPGDGTTPTTPATPLPPNPSPTPPASPAQTPTDPNATPSDQPTTQSLDQWLAGAPTEARAMFDHYQALDRARRAQIVSTLTAAQKAYTPAELAAMSTPALEKLASALGAVAPAATSIDFSGRALPVTSASTVTPAPKPYTLALNKGKSASTGTETATN